MYCPKCGTQNAEDASFCRGCGANVSLVPQALAGHIPAAPVAEGRHGRKDRHRRNDPPSLSFALVKTFVGLAFVMVALAVKNVPEIAGQLWWFWMFIPAAGSLGAGVAEFARLSKRGEERQPQLTNAHAYTPPAIHQAPNTAALPPRRAGADFYTPSSVTENTTKLLEKDQ
ncbi:MAG TPA: zinc ribbon domain-containing protein [Pyrinomonadaceae bacterium]|jgi:hypothetical protein